jgi:hypothetical protein
MNFQKCFNETYIIKSTFMFNKWPAYTIFLQSSKLLSEELSELRGISMLSVVCLKPTYFYMWEYLHLLAAVIAGESRHGTVQNTSLQPAAGVQQFTRDTDLCYQRRHFKRENVS